MGADDRLPAQQPGLSSATVALVHDYLLVLRGAERTFSAMAAIWPDAPIATLLYDKQATEGTFSGREIRTSYLQRTGVRQRGFRRLLPLYPRAAEHLSVAGSDVVLSSSSAFAHGVRVDPGAAHVCYCHSPFRYVWHERKRALEEVPRQLRPTADRLLGRMRRWDREASRRVSHYIANSEITRQRINQFYGRDASVIYPPVAVERMRIGVPEDFFLVVTELVPHKGVDRALAAAARARKPIKIVGTGPERQRLEATYSGTAEFLGRLTDAELEDLYPRALAQVVPNVEEFGIAAVEAQAAGRPVVAAAAGGALETVVEGQTGLLVKPGSVDALTEAMSDADFDRFSPERIRANAMRFSTDVFQRNLHAEVHRVTDQVAR